MGKYRNESGFTAVEGLLIVLVLTVIGFGGYYVWHSQKKPPTKPVATTTKTSAKPAQSTDPYVGWKEHVNEKYKFSFMYPPSDDTHTWTAFVTELPETSQGYQLGDYVNAAGATLVLKSQRNGHQPFTFNVTKEGSVEDRGLTWETSVDQAHYKQKSKTMTTKNGVSGTKWEYESLDGTNSDFVRYRFVRDGLSYFMMIEGNEIDGLNLSEYGQKIYDSFKFL